MNREMLCTRARPNEGPAREMLTFERGISGAIGYQGVGEGSELSSKSPLGPRLVRVQPCSHCDCGESIAAQKVFDADPIPEARLHLRRSVDVISARTASLTRWFHHGDAWSVYASSRPRRAWRRGGERERCKLGPCYGPTNPNASLRTGCFARASRLSAPACRLPVGSP